MLSLLLTLLHTQVLEKMAKREAEEMRIDEVQRAEEAAARQQEIHARCARARSVQQCGAVWCSVVQCVAVCRSWCALGTSAGCCSVLQCVAVCCSVLQCVAVCCSVLQCVAVCSSVLGLLCAE